MRYMGTKRHLTAHIIEVSAQSREGPLLDLFAGTCSVGMAVASQRNVWCNDAQVFASQLATALFTSNALPPDPDELAVQWASSISDRKRELTEPFADLAQCEASGIRDRDLQTCQRVFEECNRAALEESQTRTIQEPNALITTLYGGTYFSIEQALEIDAIRTKVIEESRAGTIVEDEERWLLLALCEAADRIANTTGHFAQSLFPKESNFTRYTRVRERPFRYEWLMSIKRLAPIGSRLWRTKNRAFQGDAITCLEGLRAEKVRPAIVYADPPYTKDQYSRYYSVLETIMLGDFPEISGRGLVRKDGFKSKFSQVSSVQEALTSLIEGSMAIGADLILSYPSNGLYRDADDLVMETVRVSSGRLPTVAELPHSHSSLGASKGRAKAPVIEKLYRIAA